LCRRQWNNSLVKPARFRHNVSISIAGLVALLGAVPLATSGFGGEDGTPTWAYPLLLILLIPILVMIWGWRTGTDANRDGLRLRAMFGSRRLPWTQVNAFVPRDGKVVAVLAGGGSIVLPAVGKDDLPRLVAASGNTLPEADDEMDDETAENDETEDTTAEGAAGEAEHDAPNPARNDRESQ
jgi:hypothetical protein